jgi:ferritin
MVPTAIIPKEVQAMIGKKLRDAMNEQIKHELESYYIYLSMVAYFHSENLEGMAHWMRVQCHEEQIHAMKFFDHIIGCGGKVELLDLKQQKTKWSSPLEAFKDAYDHELFITSKVHNLMAIARKEGEFASEPMLSWFVNEQIEEESNTQRIKQQLEMIGSSKDGLILLDRELAARAWPAGSCLDPVAYTAATA